MVWLAENAAKLLVRLTFLTTQDQIKFEQLFRSAAGNEQALDGPKARDILLRSKLNPNVLSQIWFVTLLATLIMPGNSPTPPNPADSCFQNSHWQCTYAI